MIPEGLPAPEHGKLSLAEQFARLRRLIRKETSEVLRDRRTLLTLVLMPVLLYPLLAVGFRQYLLSHLIEHTSRTYHLGFQSEFDAAAIIGFLNLGQKSEESGAEGQAATSAPEFEQHLFEDVEAAVKEGHAEIGFLPQQPVPFRTRPDVELALEWKIFYRDDNPFGREALQHVQRLCDKANAEFLRMRLVAFGISQRQEPVRSLPVAVKDPEAQRSGALAILAPLILILMTITGGVYPAIDVTAGERERGTLEILMAAPVPRLSLLLAKYTAVFTVAVLTALMNLAAMTVTLLASGMGPIVFGSGGVTPAVFFQVLFLLLLFAAFFSAILLALTSFARSFKEAQAYLIPLMLVSLGPGMLSLVPGVRLAGPLMVAPLVNIVLLTRDVFQGDAALLAALVVVVSTGLYALAALVLSARIFGAEAVLFSDQGTWSDLFRRAPEAKPASTPGAALLCLALLFPTHFLLVGFGTLAAGEPLPMRMLLTAGATICVFGVLPLMCAWLGRVRLVTGFQLMPASRWAWLGSGLLGLALWPFVHEIVLLQRNIGLATITPEVIEKLQEAVKEWREYSWILPLAVIGILAPVLEELFFRGFLLGALERLQRPQAALAASALLFGLFHLIVKDSLAVERLATSAAMGYVLAWICWRSGSVFPGMLLHAVHNCILVLFAYYEETIMGWGIPTSPDQHLPIYWLVPAALVALAGWFLVRQVRPAQASGEQSQRGYFEAGTGGG